LAALEDEVGARLYDRTPEGWLLTQAGRDLLPYAERMEREVLAVERRVAGADRRVSGVVRLATTETIATRFLGPFLPRFHDLHPALTLELLCAVRRVELGRREADIVLRLTRPREPDVVVRKLVMIDLALYASRGYVAQHGRPSDPDESLGGHRIVQFADTPPFAVENAWFAPRLAGATTVLRSDSVNAIYAAALSGAGIALLPRRIADFESELVHLGNRTAPEARIVWQGVHKDLARNARIRAVTDFITEVVARET
jgi:DNA-binding transcriptional LysR family regulator